MKIVNMVKEVNTHHHTKTCRKYKTDCRFKFPRYPSLFYIIAQELPPSDNKQELLSKIYFVLDNVQKVIKSYTDEDLGQKPCIATMLKDALPNIKLDKNNQSFVVYDGDENYNFDATTVMESFNFFSGKHSSLDKMSDTDMRNALYHYCLSITDYGTKLILKREVNEIFVNNYNPFWMEAWNANMDLQLCLDYFSIITYMTDYVAKPEKKTTEILKLVNKEKKKANSSHKNIMYALANTYLTHREMGECETYYKLDPALHFKQSNIRTIFVATGFPQNRSKFLRKCKNKNEKEEGIEVDGHEGVFMETESVHKKYSMRPEIILLICLAQFVMWYVLMNSREVAAFKKKYERTKTIPMSKIKIAVCNDDMNNPPSENPDLTMPQYIILDNGKMMRLRTYEAVLRRHKFKEGKDPHEFFYSELLLFKPWISEDELSLTNVDKCKELYEMRDTNCEISKIECVQRQLFPHMIDVDEGRDMVEKHEYEKQVGEELDPDGEQIDCDDNEIGFDNVTEYEGLHPEELRESEDFEISENRMFRTLLIDMESLLESTRTLAEEQKIALNIIIDYCKLLRKAVNSRSLPSCKPPLLIVHGGAGTGKSMLIQVMSKWVQTILQQPGDDCDSPYLVRAAPTGMAAANIEGSTMHSAFNFNFGYNFIPLSDQKRDLFRKNFKNVQVVIIDEFSMMKSDQLYQLHLRLCEIKQNDSPFGNTAVVLFGDLMQLKPIKGSYIFEKPRFGKFREVFEALPLWEMFDCVELEVNHRQGEDKQYAELLNRLRFKSRDEKLTEEDKLLLSSRILHSTAEDDMVKIFGKNASVNNENTKQLRNIQSNGFTSDAIHSPKDRRVRITEAGTIEDTAFLNRLELKVGARVMLVHNVDTQDGLTNGAQGSVEQILSHNKQIRYVMVRFDNENVGQCLRHKLRFLAAVTNIKALTPIEKVTVSYTLGKLSKNHAARASFKQIPLKLSWALTAHKVRKNILFCLV